MLQRLSTYTKFLPCFFSQISLYSQFTPVTTVVKKPCVDMKHGQGVLVYCHFFHPNFLSLLFLIENNNIAFPFSIWQRNSYYKYRK